MKWSDAQMVRQPLSPTAAFTDRVEGGHLDDGAGELLGRSRRSTPSSAREEFVCDDLERERGKAWAFEQTRSS
jgi:hypothetical protein